MGGQNCVSAAARLQEKLPPPLHLLVDLAFNFWWSWSPELSSLFREIDPQRWEEYCHNPVKLLNSVSFERLTQLATKQDEEGVPHRWIEMMKASIKTIAPYFNTDRMVAEYIQKMYLPQDKAEVELAISKAVTH